MSTNPWVICPDCGIGPGADHKNGCPRDKKRHALFQPIADGLDLAHGDPRMRLTITDLYTDWPKVQPQLKSSKF